MVCDPQEFAQNFLDIPLSGPPNDVQRLMSNITKCEFRIIVVGQIYVKGQCCVNRHLLRFIEMKMLFYIFLQPTI